MSDLVGLYGTAVPPETGRVLAAGPLAVRLEAGNLRYLTFGGVEVLRAVSFVVRDRDWGTYAPEFSGLAAEEGPDAFVVRYEAVCRGPSLLRYRARIEGRADGVLCFEAEDPDGQRVAMAGDDPRQRGRFAAAWTAGYAAAIAPAGVAVWVPAAFTGPRGLLDAGGGLLPVGATVRDLARLAGAEGLEAGPQRARRLAVREAGGTTVLLANMTAEPLDCVLLDCVLLDCALGGARRLAPFEVQRVAP